MHVGSCKQFPLVLHRRPRMSETLASFFKMRHVCGGRTQLKVSTILVCSCCSSSVGQNKHVLLSHSQARNHMFLDLKKLKAIVEVIFYQSNARGAFNPSKNIQVRTLYTAFCILSNVSNTENEVKGSDWEHHAKSREDDRSPDIDSKTKLSGERYMLTIGP